MAPNRGLVHGQFQGAVRDDRNIYSCQCLLRFTLAGIGTIKPALVSQLIRKMTGPNTIFICANVAEDTYTYDGIIIFDGSRMDGYTFHQNFGNA